MVFFVLVNISEQKKEKLLEWLSSDDDHPGGWHRYIVERRANDSGIWFIEKFKEWIKQDLSILLCTGRRTSPVQYALRYTAGAGKSFLTYHSLISI
jgi:hypothetical protein